MKRFILFALALWFLAGCTPSDDKKQALPPTQIEKSFQVSKGNTVRLQKSSLKKAFLLISGYKEINRAPTWSDLKPLVVVFEKFDKELGLFEVETLAAYKVIDSNRLLAKFEVITETESEIEFAWGDAVKLALKPFAEGMMGDSSESNSKEGKTPSLEIVSSLTKSVAITGNELQIRQAFRGRETSLRPRTAREKTMDSSNGNVPVLEQLESSFEIDYYLRPYALNENFKPKEKDILEKFGFFTTSGGIEGNSNNTKSLIMQWDLNPARGPIKFLLSREIPADILPAIREGALYWNQVVGRNVVEVVEGVDPEAAYQDRTVRVNWLPWKDAGAAWANFQADPLTGEIIRGQIYMTSVFVELGSIFPKENSSQLTLQGFESAEVCRYPNEYAQLPAGTPSSARLQMLRDKLRHVMAHEAGHTMGLRHNFAGSYDTALSSKEILAAREEYDRDLMITKGAPATSSIMDYITGYDEHLIGRWIQHSALRYDVAALAWARGEGKAEESTLNYCSDEHISSASLQNKRLVGCERFDNPGSLFLVRKVEIDRNRQGLVERKLGRLMSQMFPAATNEIKSLQEVLNADNQKTRGSLNGDRSDITGLIGIGLQYLFTESGSKRSMQPDHFLNQVARSWDSPSFSANEKIKADLLAVGGLAGVVTPFIPRDEKGDIDFLIVQKQLDALKAQGKLLSGLTPEGRAYQLTATQSAMLEKYLQKSVDSYSTSLFNILFSLQTYKDREDKEDDKPIKTSREFLSNVGQEIWFADFQKVVKELILAGNGTQTFKVKDQTIEVLKPGAGYYRVSYAEMMSPAKFNAPASIGAEQRAETIQALRQRLTPLLLAAGIQQTALDEAKTGAALRTLVTPLAGVALPAEAFSWASAEISVIESLEK